MREVSDTTQFYASSGAVREGLLRLGAEETAHAVKVLRARPGTQLSVVDGEGGWYRCEITQIDRSGAELVILERNQNVGEPPFSVHLFIGMLKNADRLEFLLEKAVELGVTSVTPFTSLHTEGKKLRVDRLTRIMVAAMKQCGRSRLPALNPTVTLDSILAKTSQKWSNLLFHESADPTQTLFSSLSVDPILRFNVLIGPEGGFSDVEVTEAQNCGWRVLSLGPGRLRAETAGITVLSVISQFCLNRQNSGEL